MEVNETLVNQLAHLARLEFNEDEKKEIIQDLQKMIAFVEKLQEVDTTGVKPLLHISNETNVLRDDILQGSISREIALLNAPEHNNEFFIVPKVIHK